MRELYGNSPPDIVKTRVDTELGDILARNYDVIYMSAQKLVADSLKNGLPVGSRGSVGSSIVAYLAGITEVNALPAHYRCPTAGTAISRRGRGTAAAPTCRTKTAPCAARRIKRGFDIPFETFLGFGGDKSRHRPQLLR